MTTPSGQEVPLPPWSSRDRDGLTVVSLRGELDFSGSSALRGYLSDISRPRIVADLTGVAFIDCACLTVLVRHSQEIRSQGGSFALAGPHGAVHRILTVTGLLTWFEVHDTVEEAVRRSGTQRSPVLPAIPPGRDDALPRPVPACS
jgi:anti-anti-sigma factor